VPDTCGRESLLSGGFSKQQRLQSKAQFDYVFRNGGRDHGPLFTVFFCRNNLDCPRLGLAVSRRVSHRAVVRNRIKRQVREAFRQNKDLIAGFDCVVVAKPAAASHEQHSVNSSLVKHWRKISSHA
jgi:ribonuclease P protein component